MKAANHKCFRGTVHKISEGAKHTMIPMAQPQAYVDTWLQAPNISHILQDHDARLKSHLDNSDNCLAPEIVFDYDLIEVVIQSIHYWFEL